MTGDDARGPQEVTVVRAAGGTARRSRPLLLALAAIAVLLIGGAVALVRSGGRSTPSYPAAWDPRVSGIVQFVEQHRGMLFEHPVAVRFLPDSQFEKKVSVPQPTSKSDKEALSRALGELRALGLVHGDVNLVASMNSLTQSGVVGLYVYQDKTVYVRGTTMTPFVRVTLAHELTHALQDQHYDLTKVEARMANTDEAALVSLIEGDAIRIQNAYEKTLSPADQQAYQDEQSSAQTRAASPGQVPPILRDMLSFPYIFGPTYIDTLDAGGGTVSIDDAFSRPPVAEAQIVDPVQYPTGWKPAAVPVPAIPAGDKRVDTPQPFGQVSLFEVLGSRLDYASAWPAVHGWQGDNSVPYRDHGRTCVAIATRFATPTDAARFAAAATRWATSIPGAAVTSAGSGVGLRSCDPGAAAPAPPQVTPSPFDILSARSEIIDSLMTADSVQFPMGACVADQMISALGANGIEVLNSQQRLTPDQQANLERVVATSAYQCRRSGVS
ncbi:MAG TPA: hypothetical protein VFA11_02335 [Acidimicrobiales bacterium]|nr:hypothetical protein [Acidimicrobiales bacterium]